MKCEICHEAEAETAITLKKDGESRELYVCKACAEATKHPTPKKKDSSARRPKLTVLNRDGSDLPKPLVEGLVKATIDFMNGVAEAEVDSQRKCPVCKRTWDQIKESGRIGCPTCWKTFGRKIRAEFLAGEYAANHVGAAPSVETIPDAKAARTVLQRELKDAIAREDYRLAAELKHKLDALSNGEEPA